MGQLPLWAKKQMTEPQGSGNGPGDRGAVDMPKGRWAQRLHNNAITFKSHYDTDSVIPFPARGELMQVSFYKGWMYLNIMM